MTGVKYDCGEGLCDTGTVLVNEEAVLSCQTHIKDVNGAAVATIEGLARNANLHPTMPLLECGEPALTPMGAVVGNAVYDLIGVRLNELRRSPPELKMQK
jgi:hypothetical protein